MSGRDGRDGRKGERGARGLRGEPGPIPVHQWKNTSLRFENVDGWGDWVELKGADGRDGVDGENGTDGRDGVDGENGTGISSVELVGNCLVIGLTDETLKSFKLPVGRNGKNGKDVDYQQVKELIEVELQKLLPSEDSSDSMEMRVQGRMIQWKLSSEEEWNNLIEVPNQSLGASSLKVSSMSDVGKWEYHDGDILTYDMAEKKWMGRQLPPPPAPVKELTPWGETGDQTINAPAGSVNFAAGEDFLTVYNDLVTPDSLVFPQIMTNDLNMNTVVVECMDGYFVLHTPNSPENETKVGFYIIY